MLFISSKKPFPIQDGASIRTMQMYRMLSQFYDVELLYVCSDKKGAGITSVEQLGVKSCKGFYLPKWKSLGQTMLALFSKAPLQCAYFHSKELDKHLRSSIDNYDYVFCNNIRTASYVADNTKVLRWIDFVDAISMNYKGAASKHGFPMSIVYREEARRLLNMELNLVNTFDKALIISDVDSSYILKNLTSPTKGISVIPNSVDIPDEAITQSEGHNLVFVGSMFYDPNIIAVSKFAANVFPSVLKKYPDTKFYIVGNRPAKKVRRLASDNIIVTGFVNDPKDYLRKSNIVVAPMYSGAGVQNKILEAMAMGCCVVTTSIGAEGLGPVVSGESIVIEDDYEKMADKIISLLSDKKLCQKIGTNARQYVTERFSYDRVFQGFSEQVIDK